jgi:hypothetical protein
MKLSREVVDVGVVEVAELHWAEVEFLEAEAVVVVAAWRPRLAVS